MVRWLVLCAALMAGGCSNALEAIIHRPPPLSHALLVAWLRPFDDLDAARAAAFCDDFTPDVAARLATVEHAATCELGVRTRLGPLAANGALGNDRSFTRWLTVVAVVRNGDRAAAKVVFRGLGPGSRSHFRLIAGRWRVADLPTIQVRVSDSCSSPGPPGECSSASVSIVFGR